MNLKKLHEAFIEKANRPMDFGKLPVSAKEAETPILATSRWREADGRLTKLYEFRREGDRDKFLLALLEHEREVKHNAVITVDGDKISVTVYTRDIDAVTEIDKEYARFADVVFRDTVYAPA